MDHLQTANFTGTPEIKGAFILEQLTLLQVLGQQLIKYLVQVFVPGASARKRAGS